MSERDVDQRRNWKAETFPYDYFTVEPGKECQYCLTEKQAELLRGVIEPIGWRTRWWSETDQLIDPETIREFRDDLARRLMMGCCGDEIPIQYRYTDDGVLQSSTDGGTTWTDAPNNDPRNYSTEFPPIPGVDGSDKKCAAATGAASLVKEQIGEQLTDDMGRYTLNQLISDWVGTMIDTSNPFEALVTVVANQIFALLISAVRAALTDDVYHQFQCALDCAMADDASFNNAQWTTARSDILSRIPGIAGVFLEHLVYLLGTKGTTNLCRSAPDDTGDCSDCECPQPCEELWSVFVNVPNYFGTIIDRGEGYVTVASDVINTNNIYYQYILTDDPDHCCYLNSIEVISGTWDGSLAWGNCGQAFGSLNSGIFTEGCVNQLQPQSSVPYTLKYHFSECP